MSCSNELVSCCCPCSPDSYPSSVLLASSEHIMPKRPDPPTGPDGQPLWKKQTNTPAYIWMLWQPDEQKYCDDVFPIFSTRGDALEFVDKKQKQAMAAYRGATKYELHKMQWAVSACVMSPRCRHNGTSHASIQYTDTANNLVPALHTCNTSV